MSSPHNATGYYTVYGEEGLHADHFSARLSFGDTQTVWARTGFLGFLRRTELTDASGGKGSYALLTPRPEATTTRSPYRQCLGTSCQLTSPLPRSWFL